MRVLATLLKLLLTTLFWWGVLAIDLPTQVSVQTSHPLEEILKAAHIELSELKDDALAQDAARSLIVDAQKARIAIAKHAIESGTQAGSALVSAKKLQDELMERVQSHLVAQLDQRERLGEIEWKLHRGFKEGVVEANDDFFTDQLLRPEKYLPSEKRLPQDADLMERLSFLLIRIRALLKDIDPVAAFRRWKIRRLLKKLSTTQTGIPALPPSVERPPASNPAPWNMAQLRARLSSITALRSTQSQTAAAEARDASAADLIDNAPAIRSEVVLKKPRSKAKSISRKDAKYKPLPGGDGTKADRKWIKTYRRVGPAARLERCGDSRSGFLRLWLPRSQSLVCATAAGASPVARSWRKSCQ
ncbi:myosin heavy chain [Pseudozyma hubeiensis SY62]|uniref:Myosin heavy chain n=1 Tax=Pseudozyma hubeiensis (strain SY62) TaxID=1305764 RepID=R9P0X9_PSEHS|nr:myosin heavy chain [Pseudozyma hubeiensis SY62]GAC94747.1 myosin heavy chain [Pseudozyma hubeiensis SY62]